MASIIVIPTHIWRSKLSFLWLSLSTEKKALTSNRLSEKGQTATGPLHTPGSMTTALPCESQLLKKAYPQVCKCRNTSSHPSIRQCETSRSQTLWQPCFAPH
uniref:Uncharacterized protein n=1 Tax=viral metagenome TaxID=1070528 RepID=A0A6C0C0X8_9ZZZZ